MLDEYREQQQVIYRIMKNAVMNKKLSHAYLFDIKNYIHGKEMAMSFIKYLLCPTQKSNFDDCGECTQCKKIDDSNYSELKVINPDGIWIKKEQLDELQIEFSKKPLEGNYKIYIINQVERLNQYAANSLLKFLEEPEEGIIAILITNNLFQVLETIRSRCQILSFIPERKTVEDQNNLLNLYMLITKNNDIFGKEEQEKYEKIVNNIIEFIQFLEKKGKETLLYTNKLWHNNIHEKEQFLFAFDIMTFFYEDIMNEKCQRPVRIFQNNQELIHIICEQNTLNNIVKKINIIMKAKQKVKVNMNNNLLIDKLILDLLGGEESDRSSRNYVRQP